MVDCLSGRSGACGATPHCEATAGSQEAPAGRNPYRRERAGVARDLLFDQERRREKGGAAPPGCGEGAEGHRSSGTPRLSVSRACGRRPAYRRRGSGACSAALAPSPSSSAADLRRRRHAQPHDPGRVCTEAESPKARDPVRRRTRSRHTGDTWPSGASLVRRRLPFFAGGPRVSGPLVVIRNVEWPRFSVRDLLQQDFPAPAVHASSPRDSRRHGAHPLAAAPEQEVGLLLLLRDAQL